MKKHFTINNGLIAILATVSLASCARRSFIESIHTAAESQRFQDQKQAPQKSGSSEQVILPEITTEKEKSTESASTAQTKPKNEDKKQAEKPKSKETTEDKKDDTSSSTSTTQTGDTSWTTTATAQLKPLIWDTTSTRQNWSKYIYKVISEEEPILLATNIAKDIEIFCPRYRQISKTQRLNFWGQFISALAYKESSWNPLSRFVERKKVTDPQTGVVTYKYMGVDKVTGQYVASEGLLQLSYQDQKSYNMNCGFDWAKDKYLSEKDPQKTILNPYLNLRCGIKILSKLLRKNNQIILKSPYWSPLSANPKYNKIQYISGKTKELSFCN